MIMPTVILEINGGAVYCATSNSPVRLIILDEDVEGSDGERVKFIGGEDAYVHDYTLAMPSDDGRCGIDEKFVRDIVKQVEAQS